MAHSVSEDELAKSVSDAVRKLRKELGESQQQFAYRMKTAIRTVARYETVRPPKGKVLRQLAVMAAENNLPHLAPSIPVWVFSCLIGKNDTGC